MKYFKIKDVIIDLDKILCARLEKDKREDEYFLTIYSENFQDCFFYHHGDEAPKEVFDKLCAELMKKKPNLDDEKRIAFLLQEANKRELGSLEKEEFKKLIASGNY